MVNFAGYMKYSEKFEEKVQVVLSGVFVTKPRQVTVKASSSGQPMEVDDESKRAVTEQVVTVDVTKVAEEKEEEADVEGKRLWELSEVEGGRIKTRESCRCGRTLEWRKLCELG